MGRVWNALPKSEKRMYKERADHLRDEQKKVGNKSVLTHAFVFCLGIGNEPEFEIDSASKTTKKHLLEFVGK